MTPTERIEHAKVSGRSEQAREVHVPLLKLNGPPSSPLTGSARVKHIATIPSEQLVVDWRRRFGIDITAELKGVPQVAAYRCRDTGLVFFWPPCLQGSADLYGQLRKIDWYYSSEKWEYEFGMRQLRRGDVLLEIGCGTGEFLKRASEFVDSAAGIDLNEPAVSEARRRGLAAHAVPFADWVERHQQAATVCCAFQVLEHVALPGDFIRTCIQAVRPGGRIIFGTPNAAGYLRHTYDLLDLPPHHMSRWRLETFRALEKFFPVRLLEHSLQPLEEQAIDKYAESIARSAVGRIFPKRLVIRAAIRITHSPLRRFLAGHTICVVFEKL